MAVAKKSRKTRIETGIRWKILMLNYLYSKQGKKEFMEYWWKRANREWPLLANQLGLDFIAGSMFTPCLMQGKYRNHLISLSKAQSAHVIRTQISLPYKDERNIQAKIIFGKKAKRKGIRTGNPEFDEKFRIIGKDELGILSIINSEIQSKLLRNIGIKSQDLVLSFSKLEEKK
jgi:hypothetical protein